MLRFIKLGFVDISDSYRVIRGGKFLLYLEHLSVSLAGLLHRLFTTFNGLLCFSSVAFHKISIYYSIRSQNLFPMICLCNFSGVFFFLF